MIVAGRAADCQITVQNMIHSEECTKVLGFTTLAERACLKSAQMHEHL